MELREELKKYNPQGGNFLAPSPSKRMMVLRFRVAWRGGMVDGGGNFAAPSPSKRMMALQFRVVLCGGMTDDGGNFAAPSPIKTNDGATISRRIARWKSQPEATDDGRF